MNNSKSIQASFYIVLLLMIMALGCNDSQQKARINKLDPPRLDTARILKKLRQYDSLNQANAPGQAAILRSILDEAIAMGYNDQSCFLNMDFARHHADRGQFDSVLHYYNQARPYCYKPLYDSTLPAAFLAEFGAFYYSLRSDYLGANKCYYEALSYLKEKNLYRNELTIMLCIFLYGTQEKLGHHDQALEYLKEGDKMAQQLDSKQGLVAIWTNFGEYYSARKNYAVALSYYDSAIKNQQYIWDPNILTNALMGKGQVLIKTGKPAEAIPLFETALKSGQQNNIVYTQAYALIGMGAAYNKLRRFNEAITKVSLASKVQNPGFDQEEKLKVLMEAYEGLGRYREALEHQRKLSEWQDSIANIQKTTALNELEVKFQTANKDKEIASKELLIEKQDAEISGKNTLIASIAVVACLAVLLTSIIFKNFRQKQKVHQLEIEALKKQQEIQLLKSSMLAEEQERKRLSRELHDGIGSMLSSAIMQLSVIRKQDPQPAPVEVVNGVVELLQETAVEVRRTAHNMMPEILQKQTLEEAIKNYCINISKASSLKIDVQFYGDSSGFSPYCKLVIYRVVQELVHNVVKHAQATHVIVQGMLNENSFTVTVEDNGIGFDTEKEKRGQGLKNVEARVKSLHGDFQIDSEPHKGTTVYMEFDCEQLSRGAGLDAPNRIE